MLKVQCLRDLGVTTGTEDGVDQVTLVDVSALAAADAASSGRTAAGGRAALTGDWTAHVPTAALLVQAETTEIYFLCDRFFHLFYIYHSHDNCLDTDYHMRSYNQKYIYRRTDSPETPNDM